MALGPKEETHSKFEFPALVTLLLDIITVLLWAPKKEAHPSEQYQGIEYQEEELET